MTFPDRRLERPVEPPETPSENVQDVIPPSERSQDLERSTNDLVNESARPLTEEERKAADRDASVGERVYAPASERVPRTVPGYRDVVENPDTATPERQSARQTPPMASTGPAGEEPSFTRVARPSTTSTTEGSEYSSSSGEDDNWQQNRWMPSSSPMGRGVLPMGIGWVTLGVCSGVGIWLWRRWHRERNKPINRLRRQAKQTAAQARQRASELRERMPELEFPEDAARPAVGLGTALLSIALLLWQQSQSRSRGDPRSRSRFASREVQRAAGRGGSRVSREAAEKLARQAAQTMSEVDWQRRLLQLKERWTPGRLEREKVSISKR